jgi:hypothetical protein
VHGCDCYAITYGGLSESHRGSEIILILTGMPSIEIVTGPDEFALIASLIQESRFLDVCYPSCLLVAARCGAPILGG